MMTNRRFSLIPGSLLIVGVWLVVTVMPAFSQEAATLQNLIVNGSFEQGFQEQFGVGYGWGAFSNGNAAVGWTADTWKPVIIAGGHAQLIEIKNAADRDRYAGIYQTITVAPGQSYKLTIKGLIRSTEGDVTVSDYGYRLQYGIDYDGGAAWELTPDQNWHEIFWNEQPLNDPVNGAYRFDTFETTITAKRNKLTLFIRAWKKWLNDGAGLYDLDEISFVGPAPGGFQAVSAQEAAVGDANQSTTAALTSPQTSEQKSNPAPKVGPAPTQPSTTTAPLANPTPPAGPTPEQQLVPATGQGQEWSVNYILILGMILLLILFATAVTTTVRRRSPLE